jgi:CRP-like cAMP-binding protein/anti-anti-sigma regulatory factor
VIFIRTMNRHVVRKVTMGAGVRSRRRYPPAVMPLLLEALQHVAVVELEGPLFFGTADRISAAVERLPASVRYVVLDLRRVQALDASAGAVFARTSARLDNQERVLLLSGGSAGLEALRSDLPPIFPDRDRACEWVEGRILEEAGVHVEEIGIETQAIGKLLGLDADEQKHFLAAAVVRDMPAGEAVFRQGDTGRELYFLLSGRLSICLEGGESGMIRVATFLPGNLFGEMAFIDGGARTASAVCDQPCRVLMLSQAGLASLSASAPEVVARIYAALALEISGRLRNTDQLLRNEMEG